MFYSTLFDGHKPPGGEQGPERYGSMENHENLCMSCMKEKNGESVCPHCGFDDASKNPPYFLPIGTLLQDRYLIGRMESQNGEGVTYCAFDVTLKAKVMVREFFPQSLVERDEDGVTVRVQMNANVLFRDSMLEFLAYSRSLARFRDLSGVLPVYDIFEDNGTAYTVTEWFEGLTLRQFIERNGGPATWNAVRPLFMPLLSTLSAMHSVHIGHYGISPDTLLVLPEGKMKMTNFSIPAVRRISGGLPEELPDGCAALEQYTTGMKLTEGTDVYAFAACLFFALTARLPQVATRRKFDARLLIPTAILKQIPQHVVGALANALQVMPEKRTRSFERLRAELSVAPVVAAEQEKLPVREAPPPPEQKVNAKGKKQLPDFVIGLIAFFAALFVFAMAGWAYLAATSHNEGETAESSSQQSGDTSSASESGDLSSGTLTSSGSESETSSQTSSLVESVIVPNYINGTLENAQKDASITILVQDRQFSETVPEGSIISQSLDAGTSVQKGAAMSVVVSKGAQMRTMPNILGANATNAKSELVRAGFKVGKITEEETDAQDPQTVIRFVDSTYEQGKKYEYGSVIDLVVAKEPA